jgi:hypothetical protein
MEKFLPTTVKLPALWRFENLGCFMAQKFGWTAE